MGTLTSLALACPPSAPVYHHAQQASSAPQQQIHSTTHATALGNALPADCVGPPRQHGLREISGDTSAPSHGLQKTDPYLSFPPHCPSLGSVPFPASHPQHSRWRGGVSLFPGEAPAHRGGGNACTVSPFPWHEGRTASCVPGCPRTAAVDPVPQHQRGGRAKVVGAGERGCLACPFCNRHKRLSRFSPELSVTLGKLLGKACPGTGHCVGPDPPPTPPQPRQDLPQDHPPLPKGPLHGRTGPGPFGHQL